MRKIGTMKSAPKIHTLKRKPLPPPAKPQTSSIVAHDYDPISGHLDITFEGGRRYRYHDVPEHKAANFQGSESKGRHLNTHIIPHHDHTKISD